MLKIKHTKEFSNQYFNEHPHKYNLFGLSKMLSEYGIENASLRITDKQAKIGEIPTPFITFFGGGFVVVSKVDPDNVSFMMRDLPHVVPTPKFIEAWSGIVLLAEPSPASIEPEYKEHRKKELLNLFKKAVLFCACVFILLLACFNQSLYTSLGLSLLLLVNLAGVFIGWQLMLKHLHIQSQYADKICSLFKQSDCNSVLDSNASKLFGIVGWSEVGLGYFIINIIILLFVPALVPYMALINIATLPFSFWSVWYQYKKAKQWCPLCLIVQILLWSIFAVSCVFGYIRILGAGTEELLTLMMIGSGYIVAVLGINLLSPKVTDRMVQGLRQSINSIKADEEIFEALLKKHPFYGINFNSIIHFGSHDSPIQLTVLTNPYCNPCSRMHKRIEKLLEKTKNRIGVQYILSSFKEELNTTNKYLIAACLADDSDSARQIFTDWFENGRELKDEYYKDWYLDIEAPEVVAEFEKHEAWRKKSQIRGTPAILVNGYQLPENYKIEDLQNFIDFNVDIK